ncbi:MAG: DMT family transporter [Haliscomenobacter sp.]|nr:DMT family transporter [Haliscomenobacter sp.]
MGYSGHGFQGAILGILSGATFALLAFLNRVFVKSYSSIQIAFHQDLSACLFLCVPFFMLAPAVSPGQLALIALLGVVFTAFSHALFIHGIRHVPARSASLIATLEPVYGIVAAAVFLSETPSLKTMAGEWLSWAWRFTKLSGNGKKSFFNWRFCPKLIGKFKNHGDQKIYPGPGAPSTLEPLCRPQRRAAGI